MIYFNLLIISIILLFTACPSESVFGCMDVSACNYNPEATEDDNTCNIPLDNIIDITYVEASVSGLVGETLVSHIHLKNASCEQINDLIVNMSFHNANASSYFCFNGTCFTSAITLSPFPLSLSSFEEDDYFKGYLVADAPGTYEVGYHFYLENNPNQGVELVITYEVN